MNSTVAAPRLERTNQGDYYGTSYIDENNCPLAFHGGIFVWVRERGQPRICAGGSTFVWSDGAGHHHFAFVVRREPASGPRAGGLNNPQLVVVSRGVSYADLDLSKPAGVAELQTRARNTARDVCLELTRLYPKAGGQYVYSSTDCVKKTTDDGMDLIKQITAVAAR
jgi:UrcA family protein